jgi:pyocin large subunit-like protein
LPRPRSYQEGDGPDQQEFGVKSAAEYAQKASDFFIGSQKKLTPTKIGRDGTIKVYDPLTNTFGSYRPDGRTKTFYRPNELTHGYPSNEMYWNSLMGDSPWVP